MVPLNQLSEKRLLYVYYLASEIKDELEMTIHKTITIPSFRRSSILHYPAFYKERKDTALYLKEMGYVVQSMPLDREIYITVDKQDDIFSLCIEASTIYHKRFKKVSTEKNKIDELTEEQVEKFDKVIEIVTIRLALSHPPHIFYIPLQQFSSEVQTSDVLGLLYKADKDFGILRFTNIVGKSVAEQEVEIRVVDEKMEKALADFQKCISERLKNIKEKRKQVVVSQVQPEPKKEPLEVIIREGSRIAIEKSEEEPAYKFPHKLPRGTKWESITIKFIDDDTVQMLSQGKTHTAHYKEMGLEGKGGKPSVLWVFLRVLAMYSGEIKSNEEQADDKYKKQKQSLSDALEIYFGIDFDPFYPYQMKGKTNRAYRVKFTLIPPEKGFSFEKKEEKISALTKPVKNDPFADLALYMDDIAPSVFEQKPPEKNEA